MSWNKLLSVFFTQYMTGVLFVATAVPCFSQCVQPATRSFGPYAPAPGAAKTLQNPLLDPTAPPPATLKIVTLGDSVVWGDGNIEPNKFSVKVAHDLANATGRPTIVVAYAHSGARLYDAPDQDSLVPVDGTVFQMDLNSERPTTTEQAECAASKDSEAEVVLLDGCINEVGATNIALPLPFNWMTPEKIHATAYTACSQPMRSVIDTVKLGFPKATIIVINYYQIVTENSIVALDQQLHAAHKGSARSGTPEQAAEELDKEQKKLLALSALSGREPEAQFVQPVPPPPPAQPNDILHSWQANSAEFLNTSQDCFQWAVAAEDGMNVDKLDDTQPTPSCPTAQNDMPPSVQQATSAVRVFLAQVDNEPGFGYGVPNNTHEWVLPSPMHPDDMYQIRVPICEAHYSSDLGALEGCKVNAIAHPRVNGAETYHQSILSILQKAWAQPAH
jgi:hypothetical protein